jgi:hypothetical protein
MRSLLAPLLLVAALRAQTSAVVDALATGNYDGAFAMLEQNMAPQEPTLRLRAVTLLAKTPGTPADRHERALRWAAQILPHEVPNAQSAELQQLAGDIGRQLTALLLAHRDALVDGRVTDRTMLGAGINAHQALRVADLHHTQDTILLALHMAPLLFASDRSRDVIPMVTDALEATPSPTQASALHGFLGRSLLLAGRAEAALPHLRKYVAGDPSNASVVLPLARELPAAMAKDAANLLQAVIGQRPSAQTQPAWTECLGEFYGLLDKHGAKRLELPSVGTTRLPMPQVWQQSLWGQGFRVYQDPNVRPSKIASGKDGLILPAPFSNGWRQRNRPPEELQRWQNCAYCMQRGAEGPTLVVYWFGPNLEYWYGDTPVERGVTGKTVRGHSAGAIARFIWDTAYGEDAKARQLRYTPHAAPGFALSVGGQRKTFAVGDTVFDETVFSHGQVSVAVLLRATERQLVELEPELRWIYRTIAKD